MLNTLSIKHFTIVDELTLDFDNGMSTFTGETGAGKSIIIEALSLALGQRCDGNVIRDGKDKCEICASFDIESNPDAKKWLEDHDIELDEELILRRVINAQGRSKSFINGNIYPLQKVRELGVLLVNIHGQHHQYELLKPTLHLEQLDAFAINEKKLLAILKCFQALKALETEAKSLSQDVDLSHKHELLNYQVNELNELALSDNELGSLNKEHQRLSQAQSSIEKTQAIISLLENDDGLISLINQIMTLSQEISETDDGLTDFNELVNQASIHSEEALAEINRFNDNLTLDPERLNNIEKRLEHIYDMARKHHVKAEELLNHHKQLETELESFNERSERMKALSPEIEKAKEAYMKMAKTLHTKRVNEAKILSSAITTLIRDLGMPNGVVDILVEQSETISAYGTDKVEYYVTLNKGFNKQPLRKIASGGELSRISLAIQVLTAEKKAYPTLIFDEVDTGIGGATAAKVGQLLRRLGKHTQVLCVTHQAQVAANANWHFLIEKKSNDKQTYSEIKKLTQKEKIAELGRMLSGVKMTKQTLAHAKELLVQAESATTCT